MAENEHVNLIQSGVMTWNNWRAENPRVSPNLSGVNLSRMNLVGAKLTGANLSKTNLSEALLDGTSIEFANLQGAVLSGALLRRASLTGTILSQSNLIGADLNYAKLKGANLVGANLRKADLIEVDMSGASVGGADFSEANLFRANLSKVFPGIGAVNGPNLSNAYLQEANFTEADFKDANLSGADLRLANLNKASFVRSNLSKTDLRMATLQSTKFIGTNLEAANLCRTDLSQALLVVVTLRWADFTEANLSRAIISEAIFYDTILTEADFTEAFLGFTLFGNVNLSNAKELKTIFHTGPSSIGIDTFYLSQEKLPKEFLLGAGVPEAILEQTTRLFTVTIEQYYSCFISYSSKDKEFAEQLYRDLRNAGVHCWFAPEDLKTGEVIRASIENSIRKYDKLLIILSENSLSSDWVASEVEAAQEEERKRHNRTILFPIRLDDEIMDTDEAWAAEIRRTRHIGDFSQWQDHDAYYQAFERLLWDLKVEG